MILDGENLFFNKKAVAASLTSDVIAVGKGESSTPMHIFVAVDKTEGAAITVNLQTAADEAFGSPATLATFTAPHAGFVPRGNKGFLRLTATSDKAKGTITAGLVYDDNVSV